MGNSLFTNCLRVGCHDCLVLNKNCDKCNFLKSGKFSGEVKCNLYVDSSPKNGSIIHLNQSNNLNSSGTLVHTVPSARKVKASQANNMPVFYIEPHIPRSKKIPIFLTSIRKVCFTFIQHIFVFFRHLSC